MSTLKFRPLLEDDYEGWSHLFAGYRSFYQRPEGPHIDQRVFSWLVDPDHELRGLVAVYEGELVGLCHFRKFRRPINASVGFFLDDLYTFARRRQISIASGLLLKLVDIAAAENVDIIRWITAKDNEAANSLYSRLATKTDWVTYEYTRV